MWCTTRKPKGSSYTRSLTKLFEHSYCFIEQQQKNQKVWSRDLLHKKTFWLSSLIQWILYCPGHFLIINVRLAEQTASP